MDNANQGFYEEFWKDYHYQLRYSFWSATTDRFPAIRRVWGTISSPGRVLDFGCGNGVLSHWLFKNGFGRNVLGVDISRTGVDNAAKSFAQDGLAFQTFDPGKGLADLGSFDVVVSSHVLEHVPNVDDCLRMLLPTSQWFVLEVPLEDCFFQNTLATLQGRERKDNPLGHVNFWTKSGFLALLERHGLIVVSQYQYASAPFCPFSSKLKKACERALLRLSGLSGYAKVMATHFAVLAYKPAVLRP